MVYPADAKIPTNDQIFWIEITETPFKAIYQTRNFKHLKYKSSNELSKYIWKMKDANMYLVLQWSIAMNVLSKRQLNFCK